MRFFFVHVPKTGGHTVTHFFARDKKRVWRNNFSTLNEGLGIHSGVQAVASRLGPSFGEYYSFAFYRNTWDWAFSLYRYIAKTHNHALHDRVKDLTFEEYVMDVAADFYRPQAPLVSLNKRQAVVQLEDFRDFGVLFPKILSDLGYGDLKFKSYNVSHNKTDYKSVYTKEMINKIGNIYEEDIEFFNFKF
jgi:hypothetical protein